MYLPTNEVLHVLATMEDRDRDDFAYMDWMMAARWDIDHLIMDLDKIFHD